MSYKLTQECLDMRGDCLQPSLWRVLLVLCRFADDSTGECYPSTATIAEAARLNRRTVMPALESLRAAGWIEWSQPPGGRRTFRVRAAKIGSYQQPPQKPAGLPLQEDAGVPCRKLQESPAGRCRSPLQKPADEEINEEINEERKEAAPSRGASAKTPTHSFALDSLPASWADYAAKVAPGLDAQRTFAVFRGYWCEGRGVGTRRSDKGWTQAWQTWVRREAERAPARPQAQAPGFRQQAQASQLELQLTAHERDAWNRFVLDAQHSSYDRIAWARWAIRTYPGGALEQKARGLLAKAGVPA